MVFAWVLRQAGNAHPLSRLVVKRDWSPEVNANHFRGENLRLHNGHLNLVASKTDELIDRKDDAWSKEEVPKEGILHQTPGAMEEHEDIEDVVPMVGEPEGLEPVAASVLGGKYVDHYGNQCQDERAETCRCQEEPVHKLGKLV